MRALGQVFYRQPTGDDMRGNLDTAMHQHDQIIAAIERHDVQGAGELVKAHWELSRQRMTDDVVPTGMVLPLDHSPR